LRIEELDMEPSAILQAKTGRDDRPRRGDRDDRPRHDDRPRRDDRAATDDEGDA
jgi:small subunit ribosomal protein S6